MNLRPKSGDPMDTATSESSMRTMRGCCAMSAARRLRAVAGARIEPDKLQAAFEDRHDGQVVVGLGREQVRHGAARIGDRDDERLARHEGRAIGAWPSSAVLAHLPMVLLALSPF